MRGRRLASIVGAFALTATVALTAAPAGAATSGHTGHRAHGERQLQDRHRVPHRESNLVHRNRILAVDAHVAKNFWNAKKLTNVAFGATTDRNGFRGFVTHGFVGVDMKTPTMTVTDRHMTTAPANQTIVDIAASNPDFSTLVAAVKAAGLADTLSGPGPFTLFAPTNEAFAKLPAGTLDTLLKPENKEQLAGILTYHVLPAAVMAKDVKPGAVKTVNGATFTVACENGNVILVDGQGNKVKIIKTDIVASNGVIHVIDGVLLPPTK